MSIESKILNELEEMYLLASDYSELKHVVTEDWFRRVRKVISNSDRKNLDGIFYLFRILRDSLMGVPVASISPEDLNTRLLTIRDVADKQGKLRGFKKTRRELRAPQENQVLASIFEIIILSDLINSEVEIDLYPKVGEGNRDVEAKIKIDNRWIFVEAKAIGYSKSDPHGPYVSQCIDKIQYQVERALESKLAVGQQLALVAESTPTVLMISLGFNAGYIEGEEAIKGYFNSKRSNVSSIFMGESAFIKAGMNSFHNPHTTFPLAAVEVEFFNKVFRVDQYKQYRS